MPGIILTLHTFGEYLDFHPHVHALVSDGLFLRDPAATPPAAPAAPHPPAPPTAFFHALPDSPLKPLEQLFRAKVIHLLVEEELLPPERVQVLYSWKHTGFNVHASDLVPPEAKADLEDVAQYVLRNPFSAEKILRHVGAWHAPFPRPSPPGTSGPYSYEPCDGVDPTP